MCSCDFDGPDVFHRQMRTARKEYKCSECSRPIKVGERYEIHSGRWEHKWETYRWCAHCAAAQAICADIADCHCWLYTMVWEDLRQHAQDERNMQLIRLVKGADRCWTYWRGPKKGQLVPIPVASVIA